MAHVPVLQEAAVDALNVRENGCYVDATFGRGGHARAILDRLGPDGRLLAMDADPEAVAFGRERFGDWPQFRLLHCNFRELAAVLESEGLTGRVDGILMDLGVSSPQLDDPARGFSFQRSGPLDMRLNPETGQPASVWLEAVAEQELARVLREFGEERFARRIARAIVIARMRAPLRTTAELAAVIEAAVPVAAARSARIHPATRSFQAIRIAINGELEGLELALAQAVEVLAPGGRLVVISFHSLEDRLVKQAIRAASEPPPASRRRPQAETFVPRLRRVGRPITPGPAECAANPRARSARMRVAERPGGPA
ncbi:MAG: 16S rRNA (cytosine(1402)-N(4))-methyltransferase RsmH [Wenzhouxiangellaceae bacterium]|nr:16S rRNA (cytosine(1402)-N(4))-methyltransferase RsmH [Wenzhouxiangellaceae bacterium]